MINRKLLSLVALLGVTSARSALAADVCLNEETKQAIASCPAGGTMKAGVKPQGASFRSKLDEKKAIKETKVGAPSATSTEFRDQRDTRLKQRALGLLITEIQQLEQLYKATPDRSKDRVQLLRRLAEDYVELENAAFREKTEAEIKRDSLKRTNAAEAGKWQATATSRESTLKQARAAAIKYYTIVVNEYAGGPSPRFDKDPPAGYPLLDEVYYYLAYEYEQAADYTNARRVYLDLIQKTPNSKYIGNAYLAFAELFFTDAQNDPSKFAPAKAAYEKVIAKPPPENKVFGYAWYKLAYVFWNTGDFPHALDAFKKTIDFGTTYATLPNAAKLAESARRDLIPVYALSGSPREAFTFFKPISGDPAGSTDKTFKMMDDLGNNYLDTGHYPEAIELFKILLEKDSGSDKVCSYQSRISEATMAMKSGNKEVITKELDNQLKRYAGYKAEKHSDESKLECANRTASLVTETAMAWHLEAVGSQGQRGTNDPKTMDAASLLYKKAAETWTADEYAKFQFPKLVKEDWPTIYKVRYNMADLLYFRERWADCGPAFDSVVMENPTAPEAAEAAYAAVLCYQNMYLGTHKAGSDRKGTGNLPGVGKDIKKDDSAKYKAKELTDAQKGMTNAFKRYVCYIKPEKSDNDGQKQLVEVKYAWGRTLFEAQRWEEASIVFRDIALNHSENELGVFASQLYLESINVLTFHGEPKRPQCIDDMVADVPKFIDLYCSPEKASKNPETCTTLAKVQCDIQRLQAQRLVEEADKGASNGLELYEKAGKAYLALWDKYGATPLRENKAPQCENLNEIVYNAARAFQAGRLIASAIRTRNILLNPQFRMENTELAKEAMYEIGGNYQAIAVYDQAADWYEKYAKTYKDRKNAPDALSDAILLRLGLGQEDKAIEAAKTFEANYGAKNPIKTASIQFAVGSHYAEQEKWDLCRTSLQRSMGVIDKAALDVKVQAHAALGRCLDRLKAVPGSRIEYKKVLDLWGSSKGAEAAIAEAYKDEPEDRRSRRLGKSLDAVGEALFISAEDLKTKEIDSLKYPIYAGAGNRDDVLKYNKDKLGPWVEKKKIAIQKVDKEYQKVTELQPVPPPRWVIAAASRAGLLWGDFFEEFGKAPTPKEWSQFPEVKAEYIRQLDMARLPLRDQFAKPALKKCLDSSVKFQYFDKFSRDCESWLARNYKVEYHIVDELRGAPTLSNSGLDDRSPPLIMGGQLWHAAASGPATEKAGTVESSSDRDKKDAKKK